jgi:hypothetical protein
VQEGRDLQSAGRDDGRRARVSTDPEYGGGTELLHEPPATDEGLEEE